MPITAAQKHDVDEIVQVILNATGVRPKRRLAQMFLELVDRESWPEYYQVIPEPRCLNGIKAGLEQNKYKNALAVYEDLRLVFLNALYYNEEASQIARDAQTLKDLLDAEWAKHAALPTPRASPPSSSPQRAKPGEAKPPVLAPAPATPSPPQPKPQVAVVVPKPPSPAKSAAPPAPAQPPARASPAARSPEPELDVDVGGTPEPEGPPGDGERDGEGDEIVRQLEKSVPRWAGLDGAGWAEGLDADRQLDIVRAVAAHVDGSGTRLAASLEAVPEESSIPELPLSAPLSLALVESRARTKHYTSAQAFDREMSELFLKARRWYPVGSEAYGHILVLQRLYHALSSPSPPAGPPYASSTNFASLRAGPGHARPTHTYTEGDGVAGVTTFRVSNKDRRFVDEVHFKGWTVRLADWLHVANPDDPSRPIVAQVFRCYISDEPTRKGQPGLTVCWYYRPEQTWHPAHRQFWENEVFKTSHFADHPLEDIIEKIACQFTARHIRGRPRPPYWYPGWPLYVCDSRYNDRERIFVKIKNWNSCVPEEVRKSQEFMPIYPFERAVFPRRFASPFVQIKGLRAPGGIGENVEKGEGEKIEGGGTGRKRPRRAPAGAPLNRFEQTDRAGPSKGVYVGSAAATAAAPAPAQQYTYTHFAQAQDSRAQDRTILTAAGGADSLGGNVSTEKLPPETAKHFDRDPQTNEVLWFAAPPVDIVHTPAPQHSLQYLHFLAEKRKRAKRAREAMDVDGQEFGSAEKRRKGKPTATEALQGLLDEYELELTSSRT